MPRFIPFQQKRPISLLSNDTKNPQWIFQKDTLQFLDVNNAAIELYGYTREEFLQMTIQDIRPSFDRLKLSQEIIRHYDDDQYRDVWKHKKKNGDILFVLVSSTQQSYRGIPVWLVTITDLTSTLKRYSQPYSDSPLK